MNAKQIQELLEFGNFSSRVQIHEMPQSGSNRSFYRIKEDKRSAVLIQAEPHDPNFTQYVEIAKFLREIGIGVPEIYYFDKKKKLILEEDLGTLSLQKYVANTRVGAMRMSHLECYKKVIDTLLFMQVIGGKKMVQCECLKEKIFNYDAFRWETQYFTHHFLEMYCGLKKLHLASLQQEFHQLAMKLVKEPLYFMHRDFQSKNILIKDGKVRIVDFQSAHQGLLAYDLVSLLKDAYVSLKDELQENLIDYYLDSLSKHWKINLNPHKFNQIFLYAGLQRNMQALGAFSFLSLVKHKFQFAQYIPRAFKHLYRGIQKTQEFVELGRTIKIAKKKLFI